MAPVNLFQHDTLTNNDYFRICKLEPGPRDAELVCTLETVLRDDASPYEALSYAWGPPQFEHHIRCNNQILPINTNLNAALRDLRLADKPRTLWVDQICINQSEDAEEERSQQVNVMDRIFSNAIMVNCWLGDDDSEHAELVAIIIRKMARLWETNFDAIRTCESARNEALENFGLQRDRFPEDKTLERLGLPTRESPGWAAFNSMVKQPYFSRVWILQEMVLAKASKLLWGSAIIPGREFRAALRMGYISGFEVPDLHTDSPFSDPLHITNLLVHVTEPQVFTWRQVLDETRTLQCSVEKDRVFAMMGIVRGTGYNIKADYSKSGAEVFADMASQIISVTKSLDILSDVKLMDLAGADRPLWAPRWKKQMWQGLDTGYDATRGTKPMLQRSSKFECLTLQGLTFDTVMDMGAPSRGIHLEEMVADYYFLSGHEASVTETYGPQIIKPLAAAMMAAKNSLDDFEPLEGLIGYLYNDVLRSMSVEGQWTACRKEQVRLIRLAQGARATPSTDTLFFTPAEAKEIYERQLELYHPNDNKAVSVSLETVQRTVDFFNLARQCQSAMRRTMSSRNFFITHKGYIGVGPPCMEARDQVCFLYGGSCPYVIRPAEKAGEYLFIGDCYVHGLMDGQALDMRDKGELSEQWFCLL